MKNIAVSKALALVIILLVTSHAYASNKVVWIEAEGTAYQNEIETPKEVKERAMRDAQTKAVESAEGTFIRSHTLVSNSQVAEDLIYAAVRGKIVKKETVSSDWDVQERNLYRVKIKALVEPVYPEKGEGLSVKLSLSKTQVKEGDEVRIFYQASRDCYVYIFSIAADGSVTVLLPNKLTTDNFTRAGKAYQFPTAGSPIKLNAMFLPGCKDSSVEEKVKIIATKQKEELLSLGFREGLFQAYDTKSTGMISDLIKRLNQIEPSDWTEATSVYTLCK